VATGEVTLTGSVNSKEEKRRAEDAIERISGVKDIHNELRIVSSSSSTSSRSAASSQPNGDGSTSDSSGTNGQSANRTGNSARNSARVS
jgi:hypothetical protein